MDADGTAAGNQTVIDEQQELEKWQRRAKASTVSISNGSVHAYDRIR